MAILIFAECKSLLFVFGILVCLMTPCIEGRSARILTGHFPANEQEVNSTGILPAESEPSPYIVPSPPVNPSATVSRFTIEDAKQFIPLSIPSIQNHRLNGNWSKEVAKNEVQVVSVIKKDEAPQPGRKIRKKVDVDKFRECIFFRICKKSECFHYGRFNTCKTKRID